MKWIVTSIGEEYKVVLCVKLNLSNSVIKDYKNVCKRITGKFSPFSISLRCWIFMVYTSLKTLSGHLETNFE